VEAILFLLHESLPARARRPDTAAQSDAGDRVRAIPVCAKCHPKRQVIYIFDQMILHILFVLKMKEFFNHCGWKGVSRPAHVFLIALEVMWRSMMDI